MKEFISVFLFLVTFNAFSQSHLDFLQPQSKGSSYHIETVEIIENQNVKGLNVRQEKKQKGLFEIKPIGYFEESLCSEIRIKNLNVEQTASNASQINPKSFEGLTAIIRSDSLFKFKRIYKQTETQWKEEVVFVDFLEKAIESIHGFSSAKMNENSNWIIASKLKESGSFWTEDSTFFQVIERKDTLSKSCFKTKWKRKFDPRDRSEDMFVPTDGFEMKGELEGITFFDIQTGKLVFSKYEGKKTYFEINDPNIKSEYHVKTKIQLQEENLSAIDDNFQEYLKKWEQRKFISQPMLKRKWHNKLKLLETNIGSCYAPFGLQYLVLERGTERFRIDSTGRLSKDQGHWGEHFSHPNFKLFKSSKGIGIKNQKGEIIYPAELTSIYSLNSKWIKVVKGETEGLLSFKGEEILPRIYSYLSLHPYKKSSESYHLKTGPILGQENENYRSFHLKTQKFIPDSIKLLYSVEKYFYAGMAKNGDNTINLYDSNNNVALKNISYDFTKVFNKKNENFYKLTLSNQEQVLVSFQKNKFREIFRANSIYLMKEKELIIIENKENEIEVFNYEGKRKKRYPNFKLINCDKSSCVFKDQGEVFYFFKGKKKLKKVTGYDELYSDGFHFTGRRNGDFFWLDAKGNELFKFNGERSLSSNLFLSRGDSENYIYILNSSGERISDIYDKIEWDEFYFPLIIKKGGKYGLYHPDENFNHPVEFERILREVNFLASDVFNPNYWLLQKSKSEKGLFHKKYGVLIPPEFDTIKVTKNNLILVGQGNHFAILKLIE